MISCLAPGASLWFVLFFFQLGATEIIKCLMGCKCLRICSLLHPACSPLMSSSFSLTSDLFLSFTLC